MKTPDYRTIVAILTAVAVGVQQALPANHWTALVSAIIGAVLIHIAPAAPAAVPAPATAATATTTATAGQPTAAP